MSLQEGGKKTIEIEMLRKWYNEIEEPAKRKYLPNKKGIFSQEDCHEFMLQLFEDISTENGKKLIDEIFSINIKRSRVCSNCESTSTPNREVSRFITATIPYAGVSLDTCINNAMNSIISDFTCEKCSNKNTVSNQEKIVDCPKVFIIQLARFNFEKKEAKKVCHEVNTPHVMDFSKWFEEVKDKQLFELFAVVNHVGDKLSTGHYFANLKIGKSWISFNDADVHEANFNTVTRGAYLLFFKKVTFKTFDFSHI